MIKSRFGAGLFIVVIFAAGAVTGISVDRWQQAQRAALPGDGVALHWESDNMVDDAVDRLRAKLELDRAQVAEIRPLLTELHRESRKKMAELRPQMRAMLSEYRGKIKNVLNPEQKRRYEEIVERFDRERARRWRSRLGGMSEFGGRD